MSSGQEESLAAAPDGGACGASHSAGCRHTEKPQAQQTRPTRSCRPDSQLGCSEVSGGVRDGGGIGERALHTGPMMRPCVLLSPCQGEPAQMELSHQQPLADTTPQGFLETTALPNPCYLHSALVLEWKSTQGSKRIGRGMAPPKRNFSKTGESQDLRSSIITYDKRRG